MSLFQGHATRFPYGVTNASPGATLGNMGQLDPTLFHTYFNDFDTYLASDWTVTNVGTTPTQALTAGLGGWLLLTMAATDDSSSFLQLKTATFQPTANKRLFFKARFKVSDATQSDLQLGLIITDTTPLDATDGIYFQKDDGDTQLDVYVRKDATTGSTSISNVATVADDTFMTLGFEYDGVQTVLAFVNGVVVGRLDASSTYLPDTLLNVSFGVQNGEAVAKTMTMDYIFAAQER
jgi:hypothetical protein